MSNAEKVSLSVDLGPRSYPVQIGQGMLDCLKKWLSSLDSKVVVVTDSGVAEADSILLQQAFAGIPLKVLPAGEPTKAFQSLEGLYSFFLEHGLDRNSVVVAVGGGVIGDLVGMAAGTFLRGIDFYNIPTTLLAMVDSCIGGKTGMNLPSGKNLVGVFHQPKKVFIDVAFLATLPAREFRAGIAEVVKYGLLGDEDLFYSLKSNPIEQSDSKALIRIIQRCCAIKAAIVSEDEYESLERLAEGQKRSRALLNLGHTFGHAIEAVTEYSAYLHGEAVSIGLLLAARLSEKLGYLDVSKVGEVKALLAANYLPTKLKSPLPIKALLQAMYKDKKCMDGRLRCVVLRSIGKAVIEDNVNEGLICNLWESLGCI